MKAEAILFGCTFFSARVEGELGELKAGSSYIGGHQSRDTEPDLFKPIMSYEMARTKQSDDLLSRMLASRRGSI